MLYVQTDMDCYGNICSDIEECNKENTDDNIIVGFYLKPDDDRIPSPDWFWDIEHAIDYANRNYGGWLHEPTNYPIIKSAFID